MKKLLTILLFSLLLPNVTNNGAEVSIAEDVIVTVTGDLILNLGNIDILGDLYVSGDILENGGTISGTGNLNDNSLTSSGCTDELACNYDENAYIDDDSCDYSCHDNGDYSLSFDGDDYITFSSNNSSLNGIINTTVNFNSINSESGHIGIFSQGDEPFSGESKVLIGLHRGFSENIIFGIYDGGWNFVDSGIEPSFNVWYDISCTWGSDGMKIFINEELKDSNNYNGGLFFNFNSYIGSGNSDLYSGFNGLIRSFELVGGNNFMFTSGIGHVLYDHSGNQNHGTIYGAEWVNNIVIGDVYFDGSIDISDIVLLISIIVNGLEFNPLGDVNEDGGLNILDVVALIDIVLNN